MLKEINLTIDRGEAIVVVGPSGAGKSMLIRSIAGLENYQSGKIVVEGSVVDDKSRMTVLPI